MTDRTRHGSETARQTAQRSTGAASRLDRWLPTPLLRGSALLHLGILGLVLARPRHWRTALALAAADHLLLLAASLTPRSGWLGPNLDRLPETPAGRPRAVALTFDDGPDPEVTPRVLDLLDEAGARGSFFVIGRRAARHPEIVDEIAARGHRLENHTWSHSPLFAFGGPGAMGREIDRTQRLLAQRVGRAPRWFRPPAGMRNPWIAGVLAGRGLGLASWTRRGFDAVSRNGAAVARRLLRDLAGGDVLLLHDGSSPVLAGGGAVVLEVLPRVLDALADASLAAVPLPDPAASPGAAGRENP